MPINIAIDGPAGAGKSTISKAVAKKFGFIHLDTGALYRSIGYYFVEKNISTKDFEIVKNHLCEINVEIKYINNAQKMYLNSVDITDKIRTPKVSMAASDVSAIPAVREFLLDLQHKIAKNNDIIMDGRDIGTVILPDADVKIFLTASPEKRAERRYAELCEKGETIDYNNVLEEMIARDKQDSEREIAPLKQADDAVLVDTSELDIEQSLEIIFQNIAKKNTNPMKIKQKSFIKIFFYTILRAIIVFIFKIKYNLKFVGKENLPKKGGYVFASNHRGYTDPVLVALGVKVPFCFMAKEELFENPLFSLLIRTFGAFPVERGKGDLTVIDTSISKICKGNNLLIFPEGTRSKDGTVGKGKSGVALIASKANVPVVPVAICFKGKLKFRSKLIVAYGKMIDKDELFLNDNSPKELKALKIKIMNSIVELVEENVNKL